MEARSTHVAGGATSAYEAWEFIAAIGRCTSQNWRDRVMAPPGVLASLCATKVPAPSRRTLVPSAISLLAAHSTPRPSLTAQLASWPTPASLLMNARFPLAGRHIHEWYRPTTFRQRGTPNILLANVRGRCGYLLMLCPYLVSSLCSVPTLLTMVTPGPSSSRLYLHDPMK